MRANIKGLVNRVKIIYFGKSKNTPIYLCNFVSNNTFKIIPVVNNKKRKSQLYFRTLILQFSTIYQSSNEIIGVVSNVKIVRKFNTYRYISY